MVHMTAGSGEPGNPTVVAVPDREVSEAMRLAEYLADDRALAVRPGEAFSATPEQVVRVGSDAQILAVGLAPVTREVLDGCPELRLILKCGIGTELIDVDAALERSVTVARTAGANFVGVAEYVLAAALGHFRRLDVLSGSAHGGQWYPARERFAGRLPGLGGRTIGLVGFGAIARHVAHLAQAFDMSVRAYDPYVEPARMAALGVTRVDLDTLMRSSDVVSIHATLTHDNANLVDAGRLDLMKPSALLVNTARGGLLDQDALARMLAAGRLGGAVLDVLSVEPPGDTDPIMRAPNCLITPHLAGCTEQGYAEIGATAAALIRTFVRGEALPERNLVGA